MTRLWHSHAKNSRPANGAGLGVFDEAADEFRLDVGRGLPVKFRRRLPASCLGLVQLIKRRWGDRADEYASRLAQHFTESSALTPAHEAKARRYARLAAEAAERQFAWVEAAYWYESAAEGTADSEPGLLHRLASCYLNGHGWNDSRGLSHFFAAIAAYRRAGDWEGFARCVAELPFYWMESQSRLLVEEALDAAARMDHQVNATLRFKLLWAYELDRLGEVGTIEVQRVEADLLDLCSFPDVRDGAALRAHVAALRADRDDNPGARGRHSFDAATAYLAIGRPLDACEALLIAAAAASRAGTLREAAEYSQALADLSAAHRHGVGLQFASWVPAGVAMLRQKPTKAREPAPRGLIFGGWWEAVAGRATAAVVPLVREANETVQSLIQTAAKNTAVTLAAGGPEAAASDFEVWAAAWRTGKGLRAQREESFSYAGVFLPELGDESLCREVYQEVRTWNNRCGMLSGLGSDAGRGKLALRLGLVDEAEQAFKDGIEWAEREDCPVELGRNLQGLAAVAERRGDIAAAIGYLDRAAAPFREYGAKLFLDQVIAAKVRLLGITSEDMGSSIVALNRSLQRDRPDLSLHAAPDGTVTLMFSDIENSTPLNEQMGDAKWMEVLRAHNAVIEAQVKAHNGHVVKTMGDGYMVAFKSAADGLKCAIAVQRALTALPPPNPNRSMPVAARTTTPDAAGEGSFGAVRVRIGLHTGEMVREGGDFFGRHVNLAARVAGHASGGEIFVSGVVRELVSGQPFAFDDAGERPMKGFEQPMQVWAARWQEV